MSITHIEDLPANTLISYLENIQDFTITEKIDGSNLQFGIDADGFYTSRGQKGNNTRYRSVSEYRVHFTTTFQRFAHSMLEQALPELRLAGLTTDDCVEIEVLFGKLPNTIPYDGNNRIVFLRTLSGTVDIHKLQTAVADKIYTNNIPTPLVVEPCLSIKTEIIEYSGSFNIVPEHTVSFSNISNLTDMVSKVRLDLNKPSDIINNMLTRELIQLPLNKRPLQLNKDDSWPLVKADIKNCKQLIQQQILVIKDILLDEFVRKAKSKFGPQDSTGWIEGFVFRHKKTNEQFKLVDKSVFSQINITTHKDRDHITCKARSPKHPNVSIMSTTYSEYASLLGEKELGTNQAKRCIRRQDFNDEEECLLYFAKRTITNNAELKIRRLEVLSSLQINRCKLVDSYKYYTITKVDTCSLEHVKLLPVEIYKRTINTYADELMKIDTMIQQVTKAQNAESLIKPLIEKQIKDIFRKNRCD